MTGRDTAAELARLKRIDRVCAQAEESWKNNGAPRIEDSLSRSDAGDAPDLLSELLMLEWSYRRRRGERFESSEYSARFPEQTGVVESAWQRWLGAETSLPASVVPDTVGPALEPTHRPQREENSSDAPLPSGYSEWAFLGEGGMGAVYRASDPRLRRTVAVKKLHALTPSRLLRFRTEAEALARLSHPNIVQVFSLDEIEGQPCLVMEYISGGSLEEKLGRQPVSPTESARLIAILARAVQTAHAKGIVHRDLKPGNVLLAESVEGSRDNILGGFPKVSDFGLARLAGEGDQKQTGTGQVLGTPHYMAPEQAEGRTDEIGPACDVWSLGVMLYRCLTGHVPFHGKSTIDTLNKVISAKPASFAKLGAKVPAALESLCLRCLEKVAAKRPSAGELATALEQFVQMNGGVMVDPNVQTTTLDPGAVPRIPGSATEVISEDARGSNRGLWIVLAVGGALAAMLMVAVVGVAGMGMYSWTTIQPVPTGLVNSEPTVVDVGADGDKGKGQVGGDGGKVVPEKDKGMVVAGPLVKSLRVKHWRNDLKNTWVDIGTDSAEAKYEDHVRIVAEFNEPLYAYLIAYNADGKEQLLLPASERTQMRPDDQAKPEKAVKLEYPHPGRAKHLPGGKPGVFVLDDTDQGGTQAFAVVVSRKPLPSFSEWKKEHGGAKWKYDPVCSGVWGYGQGKRYTLLAGIRQDRGRRGGEGVEKGVPLIDVLCESLKKGGVEEVEGIAFMVKPKE